MQAVTDYFFFGICEREKSVPRSVIMYSPFPIYIVVSVGMPVVLDDFSLEIDVAEIGAFKAYGQHSFLVVEI